MTVGTLHACALRSDQAVDCWGDNSVGQIGRPPAWQARPVIGL